MKDSVQVYDGDGRKPVTIKRVDYYYHCGLISESGQRLVQGTFSSLSDCEAHLMTIAKHGPSHWGELIPLARRTLSRCGCEILRLRNAVDGCAQIYIVKNRESVHPTTV